jgi:hypothetical protein
VPAVIRAEEDAEFGAGGDRVRAHDRPVRLVLLRLYLGEALRRVNRCAILTLAIIGLVAGFIVILAYPSA